MIRVFLLVLIMVSILDVMTTGFAEWATSLDFGDFFEYLLIGGISMFLFPKILRQFS